MFTWSFLYGKKKGMGNIFTAQLPEQQKIEVEAFIIQNV